MTIKLPIVEAHVEVALKGTSGARFDIVRQHVETLLRTRSHQHGSVLFADNSFLLENIDMIKLSDAEDLPADLSCIPMNIYVYQPYERMNELLLEDDEGASDNVTASITTTLPSKSLDGLWESLVYDDNLMQNLLDYVSTSLYFADKGVDPHIISFNKVVLLHGPPGTGKTSLCRALSQKLSIRLSERYSYLQLVEINSHSLFSKFFSESGKLVMKMFQSIKDLCDDPETFVCVLIDEVESLTAARKTAASGMEPSDAIRVVNALLTQIDSLKPKPNVLILATSNITDAIDSAFIDRADIKQYIGLPSKKVIYSMLSSTILELCRCGLVYPEVTLINWRGIELFARDDVGTDASPSDKLFQLAGKCVGFSGRTIRKLPFLAHALHIKSSQSKSVFEFLSGLEVAIDEELNNRQRLGLCDH